MFPLPGQAVFDRDKQQVAAVSRAPGNLDLFVIGFDNRVWTTFWNDAVGWNPDWFPLPGQAVFDREQQQMAAVSRAPGNLDLFVIGFDNHVWTTFWNDQVGWNPDWFPLPGQAVFDREQAADRRRVPRAGNLDLFVIGFDNRVWTTFWNDQGGWNADWFPLPGQAVFDREQAADGRRVARPGNLDLFVIGFDNRVWTTFWNDQVGWNRGLVPAARPGRVRPRASSRWPPCLAGPRQSRPVRHRLRQPRLDHVLERPAAGTADWFPLPGQAVFDRERAADGRRVPRPGQSRPVRHRLRQPRLDHLLERAGGWNADWFPLPGQAVFDRERAAAGRRVSRAPRQPRPVRHRASTTTSGPPSGTTQVRLEREPPEFHVCRPISRLRTGTG